MTKREFEEGKIRLVMKVLNMTHAQAARFVRRSKVEPAESAPHRRRGPGVVPTKEILNDPRFMPAEEFFKMAEEDGQG